MAYNPDEPVWSNTRVQWACVILAGALAAGLGFGGFWQYFRIHGSPGSILDAAYLTALLFTFQFDGELGPKPWALEVARFLAPAVTSITVVLTLLRMMGRRWQLTHLTGHVVVCGLGCKGVYLAKRYLRDGKQVVIVEADENNDWIEVCRSLGAMVLNGDAADEDMLRQAHIATASHLIAVCEKDTTNIQIATLASALTRQNRPPALAPLNCLVHIGSLKWCASLRNLGVVDGSEAACSLTSFNFFENSARALLTQHPLDRARIGPEDLRQVHLVLIDANDMAEALAIHTMRTAHAANHARPRITVIDEHAERQKNLFHAQFPLADQTADIVFRCGTAQDPAVRQDLVAWAADGKSLMTVAVCTQDEMTAMETALTLPSELRHRTIPIFVRLAEESGIAGVLEHAQQKLGIRAFGAIHDGCRIHDKAEATAAISPTYEGDWCNQA